MNAPDPHVIQDGLAIYRVGEGRPVLLMPGPHRYQLPGDGTAAPLIDGLVRLGRQVISFDPPGSGRSTRRARVDLAEMHECALESLRACGVYVGVTVMGHSMAGLVALAYALEHPPQVRRLVLVGTGSGGPSYLEAPGALWNRTHPAFGRMARLGAAHALLPSRALEKRMLNHIRRHSFVDPAHAGPESAPEAVTWRDWLRPRRGHSEWYRTARHLDYSARLGELGVPTLVLCGQHDPQFPPSASRELATGIPGARLVLFDSSGHYPFLEEPEAFWGAVDDFLCDGG